MRSSKRWSIMLAFLAAGAIALLVMPGGSSSLLGSAIGAGSSGASGASGATGPTGGSTTGGTTGPTGGSTTGGSTSGGSTSGGSTSGGSTSGGSTSGGSTSGGSTSGGSTSGGSTSGGSTTGGSTTGGSTGDSRPSPRRVTLAVSCRRRVCTAHGKVIRPSGTQCNGRVIVAYITGKKRLGVKSGKVGSNCTYRIRTRLHVSKRISRKQRSRAFAQAYFAGNSSLTFKLSRPVHVRVR